VVSFTYSASDGSFISDPAVVSIDVNAAPIAGDDSLLTAEDTPLTVDPPGILGNNMITGGSGGNTIIAGDGGNNIQAGDGGDYIWVGDGNNSVTGGDGEDAVHAGSGDNTIVGGDGSDYVSVGDGVNTINAGGDGDTIDTGVGGISFDGGNVQRAARFPKDVLDQPAFTPDPSIGPLRTLTSKRGRQSPSLTRMSPSMAADLNTMLGRPTQAPLTLNSQRT